MLKYVEWFVQLAATDPDAAAAAGINNAHLYTDFSFSKEVRSECMLVALTLDSSCWDTHPPVFCNAFIVAQS